MDHEIYKRSIYVTLYTQIKDISGLYCNSKLLILTDVNGGCGKVSIIRSYLLLRRFKWD